MTTQVLFRNGNICTKSTITVGELREVLQDLPGDMPVLATWEGILTKVVSLGVQSSHPRVSDEFLFLDASEDTWSFDDDD